jgi:hypothetical protein
MSKSKKKTPQKQVQLSPENYIRQKARSLPIAECFITPDWEDYGECNILVARQHVNGNYTLGIYLIDTFCLGVKDAGYRFNIDKYEYEELRKHFGEQLEPTTYNEAHNIIFGALGYAEELGFKPHRDFGLAQCILEEDTDDIPLIEYEFGREGKPMLIVNTRAEANRYLSTLQKAVGDDYVLLVREDEDFHDDYDCDCPSCRGEEELEEEYDEIENEYLARDMSFEEMLTELDKYGRFDFFESGEIDSRFHHARALTNLIAEKISLVDDEKENEYYRELYNDLGNTKFIGEFKLPNSLFQGIKIDTDESDIDEDYFEAEQLILRDNDASEIVNFEKKYGKCAAAEYLRLIKLATDDKIAERNILLDMLLQEYPDYFLFKLLKCENDLGRAENEADAHKELFGLLRTTDNLTEYEFVKFVFVYERHIFKSFHEEAELEKLCVIEQYIEDAFSTMYSDVRAFLYMIRFAKISRIINTMLQITGVLDKIKK